MASETETRHGIEHAALSDVGLRRANNQDSFVVFLASNDESWRRRGHLFIVADGMGAHAAGELASKLAVDTISHTYHKLRDKPAPVALKEALQEANQIIYNRGIANPDFEGMGTTATALLLMPSGAIVGQVGDSRAYRLRGTQLEQLSFDHSLVWELAAAGQLPKDSEAVASIPKNIITRSLGPNAVVEVDLEGPFPIVAGDVFLLCSDGLSGEVKDEEIGAILQCLPPREAIQLLIDLANLRGGPDNITVIIARAVASFSESGADAETPADSSGMHPLVWGSLILTLLVAGALAVFASPLAGLIAGALGLVATLVAASRLGPGTHHALRGRLGRGPHRAWNCKPDPVFVKELVNTFEQLRKAAVEEDWRMDWGQIDTLIRDAQQSAANRNYSAAVAGFGRAISAMIRALKNQGGQQTPKL